MVANDSRWNTEVTTRRLPQNKIAAVVSQSQYLEVDIEPSQLEREEWSAYETSSGVIGGSVLRVAGHRAKGARRLRSWRQFLPLQDLQLGAAFGAAIASRAI